MVPSNPEFFVLSLCGGTGGVWVHSVDGSWNDGRWRFGTAKVSGVCRSMVSVPGSAQRELEEGLQMNPANLG